MKTMASVKEKYSLIIREIEIGVVGNHLPD